jgi:hypothetical protein
VQRTKHFSPKSPRAGPARSRLQRASPGGLEAFVARRQSAYQYTFTEADLAAELALSASGCQTALRRLVRARRLVRPWPRRGFFVIVPPEYQAIGAPPTAWVVTAVLDFLGEPAGYAGLLTAAEWHGVSPFAAQETQLVVARNYPPVRLGSDRLVFVAKHAVATTPRTTIPTPVGPVPVSTPEATVIDLVRYARRAGGWSTVAAVVGGLGPSLRAAPLTAALDAAGDVTAAQRTGLLLEDGGYLASAAVVARWLARRKVSPRTLDPRRPSTRDDYEPRWSLHRNRAPEIAR